MKKIKILLGALVLLLSFSAYAQILKPVKWTFTVEQKKAGEATLVFTAKIDKGYHVYSQFVDGNAGPVPTTFEIKKNAGFELIAKVTEGKAIEEYDQNFATNLKYFEDKAVFKQKIKIKSAADFKINGVLNFMVCNDKMCLPPEDVDFEFSVKGDAAAMSSMPASPVPADGEKNPVEMAKDTAKVVKAAADTAIKTATTSTMANIQAESMPAGKSMEKSLWKIFIEGLVGGFAALFMPCIFPMLPLTVSYFTKKNHSRSKAISTALLYGLSIIILYVSLGLLVTIAFGSDALNELASNGIFNFVFFILLVVFAVSFLGAFEITLPNALVNASDKQSEKKGFVGIFFMAVTLAVVSFSCTGPLVGTLLVEAANKGLLLGPAIGMLGFSLALAIPFALFAAFPSLMKSLPKSGGWLNSVKVVLGFLELALALKFLSNVDLAYHWHFLTREVFLVLWIVLFTLLGFYLLGKLKFSHDSDLPYISVPRFLMAVVSLSFAMYIVPGLWGAPLKAISGFSPPQATQDFDLTRANFSAGPAQAEGPAKKHADIFHCPHGLNCFFDYEEALAYAAKMHKPLFVDFTGWSCVNCRKMEASVWSDPQVLKRFNDDYVLLSLYVDDKTDLPEGEQYISKFSGKKIKTLGNKWSDLQASRFNTNSQPYYVILDNKGELLNQPRAFDLDINAYVKFLDDGKEGFKKR